jgi:anhydro-N-acetylmuramic acid kinase
MSDTLTSIGLMSGSSLDGLDIAVCTFVFEDTQLVHWELLHGETASFPEEWQQRLRDLPQADARSLAKAHADLGRWMGDAVNAFIQKHGLQPDLIASHGHTIFHFPAAGFTTQIGDGAAIAAVTGHTVVCDFRSTDIALGGQGAPIAPIADRLLFPEFDLLLNLGGIANITCNVAGRYIAFDIGGANQILNALVQPLGLPYDDGGGIAASGRLIEPLMDAMDALPYFRQPHPKSLGNDWVQEHQVRAYMAWPASVEDRLHTACVQLARQIALALQRIIEQENWHRDEYRIMATGGGAFNTFLCNCIIAECNRSGRFSLHLPAPAIISFKEAALMALMGVLRLKNIPNCIASVTGARGDAVGGAVYGHRA